MGKMFLSLAQCEVDWHDFWPADQNMFESSNTKRSSFLAALGEVHWYDLWP